MKPNRREWKKRVGLGLTGTLLAGLLSNCWAEELPDLTLPPASWDRGVEVTALQAPPTPEGYSARRGSKGPAPVVPVPLADDAYAAEEGDEPPALDEVGSGVDAFQAEIGAPRETEGRNYRAVPTDENAVEVIQERYQDGSLKIERGMKQDADGNYILHGDWKYFDPKGTLIAEGRYVDGQRDGHWRRFYRGSDDSLLFTSLPYREFKGPYVSQAIFEQGKLVGKWTMSDVNQRVIHEIDFIDGLRDGVARWYHPNGKLIHEVPYSQGTIHGEAHIWDANGQLLKTESYDDGRKSGMLASKYPNGTRYVEAECLFAKVVTKTPDEWWSATLASYEAQGRDERHGKFTVWHSNGQKQREGEYQHAQPVGTMTWWYSNGQRQLQGNYENGQAVGSWSWWHANGQKSISGTYENGQAVGEWSWWHEDGKLAQRLDLEKLNETERAAMLKKIPAPVSPLR